MTAGWKWLRERQQHAALVSPKRGYPAPARTVASTVGGVFGAAPEK